MNNDKALRIAIHETSAKQEVAAEGAMLDITKYAGIFPHRQKVNGSNIPTVSNIGRAQPPVTSTSGYTISVGND